MIFAHISDIHFEKDNQLSHILLEKIITSINNLETKIDAVFISGDLSQMKKFENYEACFQILNRLKAPYFVITGNHDRSVDLMKALKLYCPRHPQSEFEDALQYCVDDFGIRLIALDSFAEGKAGGELSTDRLGWLKDKLENNPNKKPVIILVHQFTLPSGLTFFDTHAGNWFADFNKVVLAHQDRIKLIACGHMHNAISSVLETIPMVCCFSAKWQAKLDFKIIEDLPASKKPIGYYLHRFEDEKVVSIAVPVEKV